MIDSIDWDNIKANTTPLEALRLVGKLKQCGVRFTPQASIEAIKYLGSEKVMEAIRDATVIPDKS